MILLNDGEFIAGSTWVVGYKPTGKNSVKNKGGLWLNEVGMEDTKKEATMIDLSGAKVGDKFLDDYNNVIEIVYINDCKPQRYVGTINGGCASMYNKRGENTDPTRVAIVSKPDPRWWLKDLPDADIFEGEWLACENEDCCWYLYQGEPLLTGDAANFSTNGMFALGPLMGIKMPKLTGGEWKQSKISIADLRDWQKANG